jgi:RecA-family ATPase
MTHLEDKYQFKKVVMEASEFTSQALPQKESIIHPWVQSQSIILIPGWRGVGKTWFTLSMCDAISKGKPFGPWETKKSVNCLYLEGDMPASDVQERLKLLGDDERRASLKVLSSGYASQLGASTPLLTESSWRNDMKLYLLDNGIELFAIDNIASLTPGIDQNRKEDWDPINQWLLELRFAGITTVLVHHTGKGGDQRGTSAREDNVDVSIVLKAPHNYSRKDGCRFVASFTKARIPNAYIDLVADREFCLKYDDNGLVYWDWGNNLKESNEKKILRLLDSGVMQKDIGKTVGVSKGRVSHVKKKGKENNWLTKDCKLTSPGWAHVGAESAPG